MSRLTFLFAAMALVLGGCVASKTVVTVQTDGSAAVEQVAYWKPMEGMMDPTGAAGGAAKPLDPAQLKTQCEATAQKMGEGVTVQSTEVLKGPGGRIGAKVVYAVADITKLKLDSIPDIGPITSPADSPKCRFEFEKTAGGGKLTILPPPPQQPDNPAAQKVPTPEEEAMALAMMGPMLDGVLIETQVQFAGAITKTNAKHVSPKKDAVMLIRADLGAMGKDQPALKEFMALSKIKDPKEMSQKLQAPPLGKYIQFDDTERIEVEFKGGPAPKALAPAPAAIPAPAAAETPAAITPAPAPAPAAAAPADAKARSALNLARNYILNKRPDLAKEKLQAIIQQYPDTDVAAEAKKMLEELPPAGK